MNKNIKKGNMKLVSAEVAKSLAELDYNWDCMDYYLHGELNGNEESGYAYPFALWEDFNAVGKYDLKTDLYSAPYLDEVVHFLREKYSVMIVIEPFIYNGIIYNYTPKIYSPYLFDKEKPEHMNGLEVLNSKGQYFDEYNEALEAVIAKAIEIIKANIDKF